jgi:hypothetical protein
MGDIEVQAPWSWFWLPTRHNPVTSDPSDGRRYGDTTAIRWEIIAGAAYDAIRSAQHATSPGELVERTTVSVEPNQELTTGEWAVVRSWVGDGDAPVCLRTAPGGRWNVDDGRHRLWGLANVTQRPQPGFDIGTTQTGPGPLVVPAQDPDLYSAGILLLDGKKHRAHSELERLSNWWDSEAPRDAINVNTAYLDVVKSLNTIS